MLTARKIAALLLCLTVIPLGRAAAQTEDLAREIEILQECLDRTDPARGQDGTWRAANCPVSEEAIKKQLAELIEKKDAIEEKAKKAAAKKAAEKASSGNVDGEQDNGATSSKGSTTSTKNAGSGASLPGLAASTPTLANAAARMNGASAPVQVPECAPAALPSFGGAQQASMFPTVPQIDSLITWGGGQVQEVCAALGGLDSLLQLPVQAALPETALLVPGAPTQFDVEKVAAGPAGAAQVGPDEQFTWTITVENIGMTTADGFLSDDIPAPVDVFSMNQNGFNDTCFIAAGTLTCSLDDLAPGATAILILTMVVDEGFCDEAPPLTVVPNTAETYVGDPLSLLGEPVLDDSSTSPITIVCQVILDVEKTVVDFNGGNVESGETFGYQINLTNESDETISARIEDDLPDQLIFVTLVNSGFDTCAEAGGILNCSIEELGSQDEVSVLVVMTVPDDVCGEERSGIPNIVEAYTTIGGEFPVEALADADRRLLNVPCSDPGILKRVSDDEVYAGQLVTFFLDVFNAGPGIAQNVQVQDQLPSGFDFIAVNPGAPTCVENGTGLVTCSLGDMAVDGEVVIEIVARAGVSQENPCDTPVTNTATVSADNDGGFILLRAPERLSLQTQTSSTNGGTKEAPNEASVDVTVLCAPNIQITKTADLSADGRDVTYTITATNIGSETAIGVIVNDDLDNDLTDVAASTSGAGPCTVGSGNTVSCEVGEIPVDASETVTITAGVPVGECPDLNHAEGAAEREPEEVRGDNEDSASVATDCVLGTTTGRGEVLALAFTGFGMAPLAVMGALLLLGGATLRRVGRPGGRRRR